MTLQTLASVLCEGAAFDGAGRATLIALEPQVWTVREFPGQINPYFVIIAEDELDNPELREGMGVEVSAQVLGPSGQVLFFDKQSSTVGRKSIPDLPHRLQVMMQLPVTLSEEGTYEVSVTFGAEPGTQEPHRWTRTFRVVLAGASAAGGER